MRESVAVYEPTEALPADLLLLDEQLDEQYGEAFNSIDNPCLAEVDHLMRFMRKDGTLPDYVLEGLQVNLKTAVKEASMPYAVSTTHQEYRDGTFWWLDQTPVQVAESGYKFHKHPNALKRVDVEVAEAHDVEQNLRPGMIKVLISPKMSRADASYEDAKREHLGDDDMIRIHMLNTNEQGDIGGKFMQSLLVRDIPLEAWVSMFKDPGNIFGRSFDLSDTNSALPIMQLHKELELPESALPEGTVSIIEAVLPYLSVEDRQKVEPQLLLFRGNQEEINQKAELIAVRWLSFEMELAKSLAKGKATHEVQRFVYGLQHEWGEDTLGLLESLRLADGGFMVTRGLAARIEKAKQKTLWVSAAVITNNEKVIDQLDSTTVQHIYDNEMLIQDMMHQGRTHQDIMALETENNQIVARQQVKVGGGCAGEGEADFESSKSTTTEASTSEAGGPAVSSTGNAKEEKKKWKWKSGVCRINECPTRPSTTRVGPCDVCTCCQRIFDSGANPSVVYGPKKEKVPPTPEESVIQEAEAILVEVDTKEQEQATRVGTLALAAA